MATRAPALQTFLDALKAAIDAASAPGTAPRLAADRAFARLAAPGEAAAPAPEAAPANIHLEDALAAAKAGPAGDLAAAFAAIAPAMVWRRRLDRETSDPNFPNAHATGVIIGEDGLEERPDVRMGASLLAPNTFYPDHNHPPEEVYIALSPGCWRQNDGPWAEPGPGGLIYNPPNIVHAMQSGRSPLLAIWTLPLD